MLDAIPDSLLTDLKQRHAEPQRRYHDWTHIEALLGHFAAIEDRITDRIAVLHAIVFHDAVYDPKARDNEKRSAKLLMETAPAIPETSLLLTKRIIEATDGHALPDDLGGSEQQDCAYFLDMDLGILGADRERFDIYEDQIRFEYQHVPDEDYRKGRTQVLTHFAEREHLYFTDSGQARFEKAARTNLKRSIARLNATHPDHAPPSA